MKTRTCSLLSSFMVFPGLIKRSRLGRETTIKKRSRQRAFLFLFLAAGVLSFFFYVFISPADGTGKEKDKALVFFLFFSSSRLISAGLLSSLLSFCFYRAGYQSRKRKKRAREGRFLRSWHDRSLISDQSFTRPINDPVMWTVDLSFSFNRRSYV